MEVSVRCICKKELIIPETDMKWGDVVLVVEPCPDCTSEEYNRGLEEGGEE